MCTSIIWRRPRTNNVKNKALFGYSDWWSSAAGSCHSQLCKAKQADLDLNPAIFLVASRVIDGLLIAYVTKDDQISVEEKLMTYEEGEFQPLLKRYSQNHSFCR